MQKQKLVVPVLDDPAQTVPGAYHVTMPVNPAKTRCTATTRDGNPCAKWAVRGTALCLSHGGKTILKDLGLLQQAANDDSLYAQALGPEIDTRYTNALQDAGEGVLQELGLLRMLLVHVAQQLGGQLRDGPEQVEPELLRLVKDSVDEIRKLELAQSRIRVDNQYLTDADVTLLLEALRNAVEHNITDLRVRQTVLQDVARALRANDPRTRRGHGARTPDAGDPVRGEFPHADTDGSRAAPIPILPVATPTRS